jgi:hypothetical protein
MHCTPGPRRDSSHAMQCAGDTESCLCIWRASTSSPSLCYQLEADLELDDTASSVMWLQSAGLQRMLAVGYASGLLEVSTRGAG